MVVFLSSSSLQQISFVIVRFRFKSSKWTKSFISHWTDNNILRKWRTSLVWCAGIYLSLPTVSGLWHIQSEPIVTTCHQSLCGRMKVRTGDVAAKKNRHLFFARTRLGKFVRSHWPNFWPFQWQKIAMSSWINESKLLYKFLESYDEILFYPDPFP